MGALLGMICTCRVQQKTSGKPDRLACAAPEQAIAAHKET